MTETIMTADGPRPFIKAWTAWVPTQRNKAKLWAVKVEGDGSGFMNRTQRLANHFSRARFNHRLGAYLMSRRAMKQFDEAFREGRDASPITGELRA